METIHAIYDGNTFKPLEPIPVTGQYEVKIIFEKPLSIDKVVMDKGWNDDVIAFKTFCANLTDAYADVEVELDKERAERMNNTR